MVMDIHAHIFPSAIAHRAVEGIGKFYGDDASIAMHGDGTAESLIADGKSVGVTRFCVHSVATKAHQVDSINDFIAATVNQHPENLVGFGSLHPDYEDLPGAVERLIARGLKGVKLHPDMQRFAIDSPQSIEMLRLIEGRLPLLVHCGDKRYHFSNPVQIARLMNALPGLQVIGAHMGGYSEWAEARDLLAGREGLFVDCSSTFFAHTDEEIVELIRAFGTKNVLFGSDYPMWLPSMEKKRLEGLNLTDQEKQDILSNNVLRLAL